MRNLVYFVKLLVLYLNLCSVPTRTPNNLKESLCVLHISAPALERCASCVKPNGAERSAEYVCIFSQQRDYSSIRNPASYMLFIVRLNVHFVASGNKRKCTCVAILGCVSGVRLSALLAEQFGVEATI
jgi:hypothetical protein